MIYSVTVQNPFGDEPLVLNLSTSHEEHGIYIQSIEGIGPEKATINTTNLAMEDGGIYNSAKSEIRNIVLKLGFYESSILHNNIEDSRHLTYKYFPKKKLIRLTFNTDTRKTYIDGWVESNTPDIFSKEESCQISIICPDPNFYDVYTHHAVLGGIEGKFEFPFENQTANLDLTFAGGIPVEYQTVSSVDPSNPEPYKYYYVNEGDGLYTEKYCAADGVLRTLKRGVYLNTATLLMSEIQEGLIKDIFYDGDVDIGLILTIHFLGPTGDIQIKNMSTGDTFKIFIEKVKALAGIEEIVSGDNIVLTTITGSKSLIFERGTYTADVLNAMDRQYFDISWFKLQKGINQFTFLTSSGFENVKIEINSAIAYDGV